MSGTVGFGNNLTPVYSDALAAEGSKTCYIKVAWAQTFVSSTPGVININLLQQYQTNQFTAIQSVYINNTTCPYQVTLQCNETGFVITVPPFTQGMYPLLSSSAPTFLAVLSYKADDESGQIIRTCSTTFHFLNTPQGRYQFSLPNYGNNFSNNSNAISLTNLANANPANATFYWLTGFPITQNIGANSYVLITSLTVQATQYGSYSAATTIAVLFAEQNTPGNGANVGNNTLRLVAEFEGLDTTSANTVQVNDAIVYNFNPPILLQNPNIPLFVGLQNAPPTLGPLSDGSGFINVAYTIVYGTVLIQ